MFKLMGKERNAILGAQTILIRTYALSYLQCLSTRLDKAIFSPISVHTGFVSPIFARSAFTARTRPPVDKDPIFTINISFLDNFCTWRQNSTDVSVNLTYAYWTQKLHDSIENRPSDKVE